MSYKVEMINVDELKEYENNPRINKVSIQKVADSIESYGWKVPIVVDEKNIILAGHTRLGAAKLLGLKEVPVHISSDLSEDQKNAFRIMDNKSQDFSEWDTDALGIELEKLALNDFDLDMTGFDFKEIEKITSDMLNFQEPEELIIEENFDDIDNLQSSNVRMVSIFLNQDNESLFQDMILKLRDRWNLDNLTDAVYKAVEISSKNESL
tara:strand:+ start:198 stop:824 length:627 start_codon:yes stop_codon:yes gene_type:complete